MLKGSDVRSSIWIVKFVLFPQMRPNLSNLKKVVNLKLITTQNMLDILSRSESNCGESNQVSMILLQGWIHLENRHNFICSEMGRLREPRESMIWWRPWKNGWHRLALLVRVLWEYLSIFGIFTLLFQISDIDFWNWCSLSNITIKYILLMKT